jgi:hypothetical protein
MLGPIVGGKLEVCFSDDGNHLRENLTKQGLLQFAYAKHNYSQPSDIDFGLRTCVDSPPRRDWIYGVGKYSRKNSLPIRTFVHPFLAGFPE